jgi:esterase/lipase
MFTKLLAVTLITLSILNIILFSPNFNYQFKPLSKLSPDEIQKIIENNNSEKDLNPVCKEYLSKSKNQESKGVIVLFHGFTNCPKQYDILTEELNQKGFDVYAPRIQKHGLQRINDRLEKLKTSELLETIQNSMNIAFSLSKNVSVAGISGGSIMATFAANYFPVQKNLMISPIFVPVGYSAWQLTPITNIASTIPNQNRFWDEKTKDLILEPVYAYPRWSTHALTSFLRLTTSLQSKNKFGANQKWLLMTTQKDEAINLQETKEVTRKWQQEAKFELREFEFLKEDNLDHDFVDPRQTKANTKLVYPKIVDFLTNQ